MLSTETSHAEMYKIIIKKKKKIKERGYSCMQSQTEAKKRRQPGGDDGLSNLQLKRSRSSIKGLTSVSIKRSSTGILDGNKKNERSWELLSSQRELNMQLANGISSPPLTACLIFQGS